jgi:epoxyqueuosine reductase QueG
MDQLSSEVKRELLHNGASLVGFADIRSIPPEKRQSMEYAVSIGVAVNPAIIRRVGSTGPSMEYYYEIVRVGSFLNYLAGLTVKSLQSKGYDAISVSDGVIENRIDPQTLCAPFQHKTVATMAGLGWIGKFSVLVTKEFGPAIRLATVLTNARLECGTPCEASYCGECQECVKACRAHAISGNLWDIAISRDNVVNGRQHLIDIMMCAQKVFQKIDSCGDGVPEGKICGYCTAACPHTPHHFDVRESDGKQNI